MAGRDLERQTRAATVLLDAEEPADDVDFEDFLDPLWRYLLHRSSDVTTVVVRRRDGSQEILGKPRRDWVAPGLLAALSAAALIAVDHMLVQTLAIVAAAVAAVVFGRQIWRNERAITLDEKARVMRVTQGRAPLVEIAFDDIDTIHVELTTIAWQGRRLRAIITVGKAALCVGVDSTLADLRRVAERIAAVLGLEGPVELRGG